MQTQFILKSRDANDERVITRFKKESELIAAIRSLLGEGDSVRFRVTKRQVAVKVPKVKAEKVVPAAADPAHEEATKNGKVKVIKAVAA